MISHNSPEDTHERYERKREDRLPARLLKDVGKTAIEASAEDTGDETHAEPISE